MADRDFEIDDGNWLPLMHEMVDKLMVYRLSGTEWQVLMMFMRFCYGYKNSTCDLRWKDMKDFTRLKDGTLGKAIRKLKSRNIISTVQKESKQGVSYKINSKISMWKTLSEKKVLSKRKVNTVQKESTPIKNKYKNNIPPLNKKRKKALPKNFKLTDELKKYALNKNIIPEKLDELFAAFQDYHIGKNTLMVDWSRAWYTWVRNAPQFSGWAVRDNKEYNTAHFKMANE
jgi:hypothetical protein